MSTKSRRSRLDEDQSERLYTIGLLVAVVCGLALWGGSIWAAQGPVAHQKIVAVHQRYKDRSSTVVAESPIIPGTYIGDHRAITVRYRAWDGQYKTWSFLAFWKTAIDQREHVVIDSTGVAWAENDLESRGASNPLQPTQTPTIVLGVIIGLVIAIIGGILVFVAIQAGGVYLITMRMKPSVAAA
jgi:hypothetical protein